MNTTTENKSVAKVHNKKNQIWRNAAGDEVPVKFVPEIDKSREALAGGVYAAALKVETALAALYDIMNAATKAILQEVKKEFELKQKTHKGNITWYNFDKSIKVEADMNDVVKWDESLMAEAKILVDEYIDKQLSDEQKLIKKIATAAFSNSKGLIDTRQVFQLLKWEPEINSVKYSKACNLMRQAQSVASTKLYMRVWEKMDNSQYRNINLNFSSL
jgi:hypothetical protein